MAEIITTYRLKGGKVINPVMISADGIHHVEKGLELRVEVHPFYPLYPTGDHEANRKLWAYLKKTRELITSYPGQMLILEEAEKVHNTLRRACLTPKPAGPRFFIPTEFSDPTPKKPLTDETFAKWVKHVFEPTRVIISGAYLCPKTLVDDRTALPDYPGYELDGCVGETYRMFMRFGRNIPRELDLQHCFPD